jgi:hypothetical protein
VELRSFGAEGDAQLQSGRYASAHLVDMHFASGVVRLCTLPLNVSVDGLEYRGVGEYLRIDPISTSEDGRAEKIKLSLGIVNEAMSAAVLGNVSAYRGRRIVISLQLFTSEFKLSGVRQIEWQGFMEPVRVSRQAGQGGIKGRIEMPCTRVGMSRSRATLGLRVTDAQQQLRYPGDLFCQYIQVLKEQPYTWLSKRFQEIEG